MIVLEPFSKTNNPVIVDWDYALQAVENLDTLAQEKNRRAIPRKSAISILAEYGAITYEHATPPDDTKLAIIISPPCVYFCPSQNGLNGVFIEEYNEEKHGKCFFEVTKDDLSCYTNIGARLDAWAFFGDMVSLVWQSRMKKEEI